MALIVFWPNPVDAPVQGQMASTLDWLHRHGVPSWVDYAGIEAAANVALFIPAGIAGQLAFPGGHWWRVTAAGMLASGSIELVQSLLLPHRFASLLDVITNTLGALLGALLARRLAEWSGGPAVPPGNSGPPRL